MDIATYVSTFPENSREVVVEQIMKGKLLKQAMNTTAGKVIINSAIDDIHKKLMAIINLCISDKKSTAKGQALGSQIEQCAKEMLVTYRLMRGWAEIIMNSDRHEGEMKKK